MFVAVAWSTVAGNAFAIDEEATTGGAIEADASDDGLVAEDAKNNEEATEAQTNETALVNFRFVGLDTGVMPSYELTKNGEKVAPYDPSDPIIVNIGDSVQIFDREYNGCDIYIYDETEDITYNFTVSAPIGYDLIGTTPIIAEITQNQTFEFSFKKYEGPYKIEYTVTDNDTGLPVSGAKVVLRLNN